MSGCTLSLHPQDFITKHSSDSAEASDAIYMFLIHHAIELARDCLVKSQADLLSHIYLSDMANKLKVLSEDVSRFIIVPNPLSQNQEQAAWTVLGLCLSNQSLPSKERMWTPQSQLKKLLNTENSCLAIKGYMYQPKYCVKCTVCERFSAYLC